MVAALFDEWQAALVAARDVPAPPASNVVALRLPDGVSLAALVEQLHNDGRNDELRSLLESGIETVFVRPAQSKARNLPVDERVRIVFRDTETLDLPRRGRRFEPRSFSW